MICIKENPINDLLDISLENIGKMVDINKVIGTPMRVDDRNIVIPISRVTFGFGAGGSEFTTKNATKAYDLELSEELFPFGGGSGGGITGGRRKIPFRLLPQAGLQPYGIRPAGKRQNYRECACR